MNDQLPTKREPEMSFAEMERLAQAVAKSGMFGIKTVEQALTLMSIAQAEGRHPASAARDYDIIEGKPSKKAEAMMRDFIETGGKIEWHNLDDGEADATFSHPHGADPVRIHWDMARAEQAGLAMRPMWRKYPRQMLRSRCVSEGVRSVYPAATSGLYETEEQRDIAVERRAEQPQKPRPVVRHAAPTIDAKAEDWTDPAARIEILKKRLATLPNTDAIDAFAKKCEKIVATAPVEVRGEIDRAFAEAREKVALVHDPVLADLTAQVDDMDLDTLEHLGTNGAWNAAFAALFPSDADQLRAYIETRKAILKGDAK